MASGGTRRRERAAERPLPQARVQRTVVRGHKDDRNGLTSAMFSFIRGQQSASSQQPSDGRDTQLGVRAASSSGRSERTNGRRATGVPLHRQARRDPAVRRCAIQDQAY